MTDKPLILVTNDDGWTTEGLELAILAARSLGDIIVTAPDKQQTGMSRSFPRYPSQGKISIRERNIYGVAVPHHCIEGSPAQVVNHAVHELAPKLPDLCISGVNHGSNLGGTLAISGTVGAALEAAGLGIPSMAVSMDEANPETGANPFTCDIVRRRCIEWIGRLGAAMLADDLPTGIDALNLNISTTTDLKPPVRFVGVDRFMPYPCVPHSRPRDLEVPVPLNLLSLIEPDKFEVGKDLHAYHVERAVTISPLSVDPTARDTNGSLLGETWLRTTLKF